MWTGPGAAMWTDPAVMAADSDAAMSMGPETLASAVLAKMDYRSLRIPLPRGRHFVRSAPAPTRSSALLHRSSGFSNRGVQDEPCDRRSPRRASV